MLYGRREGQQHTKKSRQIRRTSSFLLQLPSSSCALRQDARIVTFLSLSSALSIGRGSFALPVVSRCANRDNCRVYTVSVTLFRCKKGKKERKEMWSGEWWSWFWALHRRRHQRRTSSMLQLTDCSPCASLVLLGTRLWSTLSLSLHF